MPNRFPAQERKIVIGDIHGCSRALATLLDQISPSKNDVIVTLGDYVDRGPNSKECLNLLIDLQSRCQLIPLLGNHDERLLRVARGEFAFESWCRGSGEMTVRSYKARSIRDIDASHIDFISNCQLFYESDDFFCVHANYEAHLPLPEQDPHLLLHGYLTQSLPGRHHSGKMAVVGHTAQWNGEILKYGWLMCIDTACADGGKLTAYEPATGSIWQAQE